MVKLSLVLQGATKIRDLKNAVGETMKVDPSKVWPVPN
jgi:hypothetical protein